MFGKKFSKTPENSVAMLPRIGKKVYKFFSHWEIKADQGLKGTDPDGSENATGLRGQPCRVCSSV
jgi:hypothetical protein